MRWDPVDVPTVRSLVVGDNGQPKTVMSVFVLPNQEPAFSDKFIEKLTNETTDTYGKRARWVDKPLTA